MNNLFSRDRVRAINRPVSGGGLAVQPRSSVAGMPARVRGLTMPPIIVTNVSQLILPEDFNRLNLFIQNNDTVGVVYLSYGVPAVIGMGMRLGSSGGGILLDMNVPTCAVYMIGTIASNPNVTVTVA